MTDTVEPGAGADELAFDIPFHPALRIIFIVAGLFCICIATWELRHAILQPGWWTLFFGIILYGAWSVGGSIVVAAFKGEAQKWRFRDGVLTIHGASAFASSVTTL